MLKPFLLASFTALVSASSHAQDPISVSSEPAQVNDGESFQVLVKGTAPSGCGVALVKAGLVADAINIVIKSHDRPGIACTLALAPFVLPVEVLPQGQTARSGSYKVNVSFAQVVNGAITETRLVGFGIIPVAKVGDLPILPETGNWAFESGGAHATSGSGTGFSIDRQRNTVVAIGNFYGKDGSPEWYFQSGNLNRHTLTADFFTISGGQALFGAYRAPNSVSHSGQIAFEFSSPSRGTAWVIQQTDQGFPNTIKLMPISIARFGFGYGNAKAALAGDWQLVIGNEATTLRFVAAAGSGNTIALYTAGDFRLSCTLDPRLPDSQPDQCELSRAGTALASFSRVGLEKLAGSDRNSRAAYMFRVP